MSNTEYDGNTLSASNTGAGNEPKAVEPTTQDARRERIRAQLAPLQAELDALEARKDELRRQIAEIEEEAVLLRRVLRPVSDEPVKQKGPEFSTTQKQPNGGNNGGIHPESEAEVMAAILKLGADGGEFTVKQVTEAAGLHRTTTNKVMAELRDQGRIRLSAVRYPDGQAHVGKQSPHYKVVT